MVVKRARPLAARQNPSSTLDVVKAGEPEGGAWTYNTTTVSTGIIHRRDVLDKDVR